MATREAGDGTPSGEVVNDDPRRKTPPKGVTEQGLLQMLGPGLVTGASGDDPSGIVTYSQVGAQFGYGLLWSFTASGWTPTSAWGSPTSSPISSS